MRLTKGDTVKVINVGYTYTTYSAMAHRLGAKNWKEGNRCNYNDVGIIYNIGRHSKEDIRIVALVYLTKKKKDVLIGVEGLEKLNVDLFGEPITIIDLKVKK